MRIYRVLCAVEDAGRLAEGSGVVDMQWWQAMEEEDFREARRMAWDREARATASCLGCFCTTFLLHNFLQLAKHCVNMYNCLSSVAGF